MRAIRFARAQAVIHHTHERWKTYFARHRRASSTEARTSRARAGGHMEPLEQRQLMAATPLTFTADAGKALDLTISLAGANLHITGTHGSDNVNITQALADTTEIVITGADAVDQLELDNSVADLAFPVTFNGSGAADALTMNGTANADRNHARGLREPHGQWRWHARQQ